MFLKYYVLYFIPVVKVIGFVYPIFGATKNNNLQPKDNFMSTQVYGIENIKKIFNVGITIGMAADSNVPAWKDGKVDAADFAFFPMLFPAVGDLISLQWNQIIPETKELSAGEIDELYNFFKDHLILNEKSVEAIVEEGLGIVIKITGLVMNIIALVKEIKA